MWLERLAAKATTIDAYPFPFVATELDFHPLFDAVIHDRLCGRDASEIARDFQRGIANPYGQAHEQAVYPRLVLPSVTEGTDKPLKYQTILNIAEVVIITKSDFANAVEFDEAAARRNIQAVRPGIEVFQISAKTREGTDDYLRLLETRCTNSRTSARV